MSRLSDIERDAILAALAAHRGNRTHAAKALGISIRTLSAKLNAYRSQGIHVQSSEHLEMRKERRKGKNP